MLKRREPHQNKVADKEPPSYTAPFFTRYNQPMLVPDAHGSHGAHPGCATLWAPAADARHVITAIDCSYLRRFVPLACVPRSRIY